MNLRTMFVAAFLVAQSISGNVSTFATPIALVSLPEEPLVADGMDISNALSHPKVVDVDYNWNLQAFIINYDLTGGKTVNYRTARRVMEDPSRSPYGNSIYSTQLFPFFYWYDINEDGRFLPEDNEVWHDPEEDGVNGNEVLYKNPQMDDVSPRLFKK